MTTTLGQIPSLKQSPLQISNDAHCQRVACLATEVGHRLNLNSRSIETLNEAAINHHSMALQWTPDGKAKFTLKPGLARPRDENSGPHLALRFMEVLRVFDRVDQPKPGSQPALLAEVLRLANAFDEIYEWRMFERGLGSDSVQELNLLMQSGLWSNQIHQAFCSISSGNRDRAMAQAESLPLSTSSKIQKLALTKVDELTVDFLEHLALADPVLSADLLRVVNSAKHTAIDRVSSVRQAIEYLGTTEAREVMLESAARGIFASSSLHRLWKHSVKCANTMKAVASHVGLDQNRAFLLGLLHDIGRVPLECLSSVTKIKSGHTQFCNAEPPAIWLEIATAGCDHAELGAEILIRWNFPESVTESLRHHHNPDLSAERLTALLYLVECVEGADEDVFSLSQVAAALDRLGMSECQFTQALAGERFRRWSQTNR